MRLSEIDIVPFECHSGRPRFGPFNRRRTILKERYDTALVVLDELEASPMATGDAPLQHAERGRLLGIAYHAASTRRKPFMSAVAAPDSSTSR